MDDAANRADCTLEMSREKESSSKDFHNVVARESSVREN